MFDQTALRERLGPGGYTTSEFRDNFRLHVAAERIYDCLQCLRESCGFDMLIDLSAVDYLDYPGAKDRFGVIYALLNTDSGQRLYVKTAVNEPDLRLPSVCALWKDMSRCRQCRARSARKALVADQPTRWLR